MRDLNSFVYKKMNATSKTIDRSSLTDTSVDSPSKSESEDDEGSFDKSIDEESGARDSDEEAPIYDLFDVNENSSNCIRIVDVECSWRK
jgi:hypothetical protein